MVDDTRQGMRALFDRVHTRAFGIFAAITVGVLFIITHVVHLDRDLPMWTLTWYQPIDELFYMWPAFNLAEHGSWVHQAVPYVRNEAWPMNVAQNLVTWPMLRIFGDTFYGMRMSSVLAGLAITLLTALMVARHDQSITGRPEKRWGAALFWALFLVGDFTFLMASRVAEPTIYRMLSMVGMLVLLSSPRIRALSSTWAGLVAGAASVAAVVWFYPHNAFVVLASAFIIAIRVWPSGWRAVMAAAIAFAGGAAASAASWFGFVYAIYGTGPLSTIRYWILNAYVSEDRNVLSSGFNNLGTGFYTNIFRFDWALLFLLAVCLPAAVWLAAERLREDDTAALPLIFFACFVVQALFVNDYPHRKLVLVLPLVIMTIAIAWAGRSQIIRTLKESPAASRLAVAWTLLTASGVGILALTVASPTMSVDFALPGVTSALTGAGLVFAAVFVSLFLGGRLSLAEKLAPLMLVALLAGSLWLDARWAFFQPTFTYRDASAALAGRYDGEIVAGGWSFAMRLYNDMEPVLSGYRLGDHPKYTERTLARLVREGRIAASIGYDDEKTRRALSAIGLEYRADTGYVTVADKTIAIWEPVDSVRQEP